MRQPRNSPLAIRRAAGLALAAALLVPLVIAAAARAESAWPALRHDNRRTARSPIVASQDATLLYAIRSAGGARTPSPAVAGPSGTVYLSIGYGLEAVDPATGTVAWNSLTSTTMTVSAPVVGPGGTIHATRRFEAYPQPGSVVALDPSGTVLWSYTTGENVAFFSDLGVDDAGRVYGRYQGQEGSSLFRFALDADGQLLWKHPGPLTYEFSLPAPTIREDGAIFLTTHEWGGAQSLARIDPATGGIVWSVDPGPGTVSGPVLADNGLVLVHRSAVGPSAGVVAFDPETGAEAWFVPYLGFEIGSENPPVLLQNGEIVAIASGPVIGDRVVYRITPEGDLLGTVPYPSNGYYTGSIAGGDNTLYVWESRVLLAFSPETGAVKFQFDPAPTAGCLHTSPPTILADGSLFLSWRRKQTCNVTSGLNQFVTLAPPAAAAGPEARPAAPRALRLMAIHPNPFATSATIDYALRVGGAVRLVIYDVAGRPVATLAEGNRLAGPHTAQWDGRATSGEAAPPGVYFCEIAGGGERAVSKIVRVR